MPEKYVPKHRSAPPKRVRAGAKNVVVYSGVAVFATSLSVGAGVTAFQSADAPASPVNLTAGKAPVSAVGADRVRLSEAAVSSRRSSISRSGVDRTSQVASTLKAAELSTRSGVAVTRSEDLSQTDPKALARALMPRYGLSSADFDCIDNIWTQESGWNVHADNPSSSAYGIPQALPGSKMASAGSDWRNNPETQIRWGLNYIAERYGTACSAWSFKRSHGWY